jgi:hypothetical protein
MVPCTSCRNTPATCLLPRLSPIWWSAAGSQLLRTQGERGRRIRLLRGREGPRHQFLLRTGQLVPAGDGRPLPHRCHYLREHDLGLGG